MRKSSIAVVVLAALVGVTQLGCRACQNPYDYSSPVSGASCGGCNECRAGTYAAAHAGGHTVVAEAPTGQLMR